MKVRMFFIMLVIAVVAYATISNMSTDVTHIENGKSYSTITVQGTIDDTDTKISSAYNYQQYNKRANIVPTVVWTTNFTAPNVGDTISVNIYEYVSANGTDYVLYDTLATISASGKTIIEQELNNSVFRGRMLYLTGGATNCDSVSFTLEATINYYE